MGRLTEYFYLTNPENPLPTKEEAKFRVTYLDYSKEKENIKEVRKKRRKDNKSKSQTD